MLKGMTQLLNNPLIQTYLPHSTKKIQFHQELLLLFWKLCDINKVRSSEEDLTRICIGRSLNPGSFHCRSSCSLC